MLHETIQGTFRQTNLTNESAEYLAKREDPSALALRSAKLIQSVMS